MNDYIKAIPDADLIYHLSSGWPLLLWILFGHNLSKHIIKPNSLLGKKVSKTISFPLKYLHVIVFLIWMIPFVFFFRAIFYATFFDTQKNKSTFDPNSPSMPPGFGYCMNTKVKQKDAQRGVLAYWDYACEGSNEKFTSGSAKAMLDRFYYINYAIFLIVLLVFNSLSKVNILKNRFILTNIRMALFLGVIGCVLPLFASGFYLRSQWATHSGSYLLTMNACCFMLIGLAVMSYGSRFYALI